jgi:hypothetical protein
MAKTDPKGPPHATEFERAVAAFALDRGVVSTRKFATINLTVGGKVFAFTNKAGLVVKLPAPRVAALIAAGEAMPLVMGKRTMKEWAVVPTGKTPWVDVAREAREFVGGAR